MRPLDWLAAGSLGLAHSRSWLTRLDCADSAAELRTRQSCTEPRAAHSALVLLLALRLSVRPPPSVCLLPPPAQPHPPPAQPLTCSRDSGHPQPPPPPPLPPPPTAIRLDSAGCSDALRCGPPPAVRLNRSRAAAPTTSLRALHRHAAAAAAAAAARTGAGDSGARAAGQQQQQRWRRLFHLLDSRPLRPAPFSLWAQSKGRC